MTHYIFASWGTECVSAVSSSATTPWRSPRSISRAPDLRTPKKVIRRTGSIGDNILRYYEAKSGQWYRVSLTQVVMYRQRHHPRPSRRSPMSWCNGMARSSTATSIPPGPASGCDGRSGQRLANAVRLPVVGRHGHLHDDKASPLHIWSRAGRLTVSGEYSSQH